MHVTRTLAALVALFGIGLASALSAQAPVSEIDAHINAAKTAAGQDYRATFVNLCFPGAQSRLSRNRRGASGGARGGRPVGARQEGGGTGATPDRATWYASPYKVFDNLYWLGTRQHSSWALRTSDGLIIIDTNFAWATEPEIIDGLTTLGLDPQQIKYVAHQPCARRSRPGRRGTAEAIRRQGRDGRCRLGIDAAAAGDRRRRRADARHQRRPGRPEAHARRHHGRHRVDTGTLRQARSRTCSR